MRRWVGQSGTSSSTRNGKASKLSLQGTADAAVAEGSRPSIPGSPHSSGFANTREVAPREARDTIGSLDSVSLGGSAFEEPLSPAFRSFCGDMSEDLASQGSDVWLHMYHCDPVTGFLNRTVLDRSECGIFHAGVEVYGDEWSFQYYEDTWEDPSVPGLVRCIPRQMPNYEYVDSVFMGRTDVPQRQADQLVLELHKAWPASSYHLTHRNCLTFAEEFLEALHVPRTFPTKLKGIIDASVQNSGVDAVVDYSWSLLKWWMMLRHPKPEAEPTSPELGRDLVPSRASEVSASGGWGGWSLFSGGRGGCSSVMCPGSKTPLCTAMSIRREEGAGDEIRHSEQEVDPGPSQGAGRSTASRPPPHEDDRRFGSE